MLSDSIERKTYGDGMGLDWVVLAKNQNELEINPTEVIGSRRASREDLEVMKELQRIWEAGEQTSTFDQFVDELVKCDDPPIVICYGKEFEAAKPAVQAESQFYGFRGKALESQSNRVSSFAESNGYDISWFYEELASQADIEEKIDLFQRILSDYNRKNDVIISIAKRYYDAWRHENFEEAKKIEKEFQGDPDIGDHIYELYSYFGAIDWLKFWANKGFRITAEY